jgi:hypothetical protein
VYFFGFEIFAFLTLSSITKSELWNSQNKITAGLMRNSISKFQRRINKSDLRDLGQRGVSRGDLTFLSFLSQTLIISLEHERRIKIKRIERIEQIYIK